MASQIGRYSKKLTGGNPGYPRGVTNGRIPTGLMRALRTQTHLGGSGWLWPEAAKGLDAMTAAAKKAGIRLRLVAGYRDFSGQVRMKKWWTDQGAPAMAAKPGTSSHGWGSAVDVDRHSSGTGGIVEWLKKNAVSYGWDHPRWAGDGVGSEEEWHWQFIRGWTMSEEPTQKPVLVATIVPIPDAQAYEEKGKTWAWVRPVATATEARIVTADENHCVLEREKHPAKTFAGDIYQFKNGQGFIPLRELEEIGVKVGWHDPLVTLLCD